VTKFSRKNFMSRNQASESAQGVTMLQKGVFSFIIISQPRRPIGSNFHRFVILCVCWDTPSEKTSL
jgi:hypothetical protein